MIEINFEKSDIGYKDIQNKKYIVNFTYIHIFGNGITGVTRYNARLYGFETLNEAKKYRSTFVKFMKMRLGKPEGKMDRDGYVTRSGIAYNPRISDVAVAKISDINEYGYPEITYYSVGD